MIILISDNNHNPDKGNGQEHYQNENQIGEKIEAVATLVYESCVSVNL